MWEAIRNGLESLISSMLESFDDTLLAAVDVLTGSSLPDIWAYILSVTYILRPFCYAVIAFVVLIELARAMMATDVIKWEMALKVGIKLALARVCIDLAPSLLNAFYLQASDWIAGVGGATGAGLGHYAATNMNAIIDTMSGGEVLGLFFSLLIPLLAVKICGLLVNVIAYARLFEIYVLLAVSPLPMAFFPLGDGNGGGFSRVTGRFLKAFAAVCLQGVMIIVCIRIFLQIIVGVVNNMFATAMAGGDAGISDFVYAVMLGAIVLVIAIFKTGQWAKQILDAA